MPDEIPPNAQNPPYTKKVWVAVGLLVIVVVCLGATYVYSTGFPFPAETKITRPGIAAAWVPKRDTPLRKVDFAHIHAQLGQNREFTETLEADTLREYDRQNPSSEPSYATGRIAAQLFACYVGGGDPHGEGYLQISNDYARQARLKGCQDPLMMGICEVYLHLRTHTSDGSWAAKEFSYARQFIDGGYPAVLKLATIGAALHNVANIESEGDPALEEAVKMRTPLLTNMATREFQAFIATKPPRRAAMRAAATLLDNIDNNTDPTIAIESMLMSEMPKVAATQADLVFLRGDALISLAWGARGSDWGYTVTEAGAKTMKARLIEAGHLIAETSHIFPDDPRLPAEMIIVEMGLQSGNGDVNMEEWFTRAVQANPDYCQAYAYKMNYLQPRWHGSAAKVATFGQECVATERWDANIPMLYIHGLLGLEAQPRFYQQDMIWKTAEETCLEYLRRYPKSIRARTQYLHLAALAEKSCVVKEQRKILGEDYDRFVISESQYKRLFGTN